MNNHYIKEELPDDICKAIDNILKVNNIHDIFDYIDKVPKETMATVDHLDYI